MPVDESPGIDVGPEAGPEAGPEVGADVDPEVGAENAAAPPIFAPHSSQKSASVDSWPFGQV